MTMGEPAFLSDDFTALEDPDLELVTTSGQGKNGALCALQRSIRPQIVSTIGLMGIQDLWTLYTDTGQENHSLIVASFENRTIVCQFYSSFKFYRKVLMSQFPDFENRYRH